ncbi:MAG TPA: ABC transporter permease [Aggregatilineales bacterium]|nr:ABC transporter permease [Aggregatilineales bacterium]
MAQDSLLNARAIVGVINASIRGAVPIMLGAMSGVVSERSGIVNIGIEGMMLIGAFAAFMANVYLSQPDVPDFLQALPVRLPLSILAALLTGAALAMLHAFLSIRYKVDQIISGTVINIFAGGLTSFLYIGGQNKLSIPFLFTNPFPQDSGVLFSVGEIVFNKGLITYLAFLLVLVLGFALFNTTWGLRTRSVGENPRAADTLGINVFRLQYTNLFISGMFAGLAGAALTIEGGVSFERGMTNGRGFLALAVMIFGVWRPSRAMYGALLFGFAVALQGYLQQQGIGAQIPYQFIGMLPYLLTLVVLAGFVGRARPPAHDGQPYEVD